MLTWWHAKRSGSGLVSRGGVLILVLSSLVLRCPSAAHPAEGEPCSFEIIMVDDRPWKRLGLETAPYWVASAVLNFAYATRFGYGFTLVRPEVEIGTYPGWHKVTYLAERLRAGSSSASVAGSSACAWWLYMDGDAFVREQDLPLSAFLAGLTSRYRGFSPATAAIFAKESRVEWTNMTGTSWSGLDPKAPFLNTGVFFVRAGERSPAASSLFDAWFEAGAGVEKRRLWTEWPGEQGVISEMVRPGSFPEARTSKASKRRWRNSVLLVNLTEMNSPWGRFIQHSYGPLATDRGLRSQALGDALVRSGLADRRLFASLARELMQRTVTWRAWPGYSTAQG